MNRKIIEYKLNTTEETWLSVPRDAQHIVGSLRAFSSFAFTSFDVDTDEKEIPVRIMPRLAGEDLTGEEQGCLGAVMLPTGKFVFFYLGQS